MIQDKIRMVMKGIDGASLVVVTKTRSIKEISEAIDGGARIIGESRVQEAEDKYKMLKTILNERKVSYHMIGHLQTNKAKRAVEIFDMIQSLDSPALAAAINNHAAMKGKIQDILVQVNIGRERQKHGVLPERALEFISEMDILKNIRIRGLMCIAPYSGNPEDARPYFYEMKRLFDASRLEILSMGMTHDFKLAIEEGSNMVRIGTGIFGERA